VGLDTTYGCFSGSYASFMRFRTKLCEVAGYGQLNRRVGYGGFENGAEFSGHIPWPDNNDALIVLLDHSDCDGEISHKDCKPLADRLVDLLPAMANAGDYYAVTTKQFIAGLRKAHSKRGKITFR